MYSAVMSDWWVILLFLFTLFIAQIGIKNEGITGVIGIVGSAALIFYLPVTVHWILYLILVLCIGMVLYKTFGPDN